YKTARVRPYVRQSGAGSHAEAVVTRARPSAGGGAPATGGTSSRRSSSRRGPESSRAGHEWRAHSASEGSDGACGPVPAGRPPVWFRSSRRTRRVGEIGGKSPGRDVPRSDRESVV